MYALIIAVASVGGINVIVHDAPKASAVNVVVHESAPKAAVRLAKYPVRTSASGYHWPSSGMSHAQKVAHLQSGEHAGQFDAKWLASLSDAELTALHLDHHEGRTQWQFVTRQRAMISFGLNFSADCPAGNCPATSTFRRRR